MDQELCPKCKSAKTTLVDVEGEKWWRCNFQGCDGRVSGDWYYWHPGQGLKPGAAGAAASSGDDEDEDDAA
jgi:hypothetical protein